MSEYIKLFENEESSNGYAIKDVPFISTVLLNGGKGKVNLWATQQDKKIIVESGTPIVIVGKVIITGGTWEPSLTNKNVDVVISGDVYCYHKVDCYSITFKPNSHLYMQPGSRLRIWEGGITNSDAETNTYISLCNSVEDSSSDEYSDMAELLIHPNVISRTPKIYIKATMYPMKNASTLHWKRFAVPNQLLPTDLIKELPYIMTYYDGVQGKYVGIKATDTLYPFREYQYTPYEEVYTGNPNTAWLGFNTKIITSNYVQSSGNTTYLGNSYLAKMNVYKVIQYYQSQGKNIEIGFARNSGDSQWTSITSIRKYVNPFQSFKFFPSWPESSVTFSYKEMVWDFSFELDEEGEG